MAGVLRQGHDDTTVSRGMRPSLTVNTQAPTLTDIEISYTQSAPVGTRQERGIPPMYQAVDRHCEKIAEMMDSPTWQGQNPGLHFMKDDNMWDSHNPSELAQNIHDALEPREYCKNQHDQQINFTLSEIMDLSSRGLIHGQSVSGNIRLGRQSETLDILGIHRFPYMDSPGTHSNTFIISAALSRESSQLRQAVKGAVQQTRSPVIQDVVQGNIPGDLGTPKAQRHTRFSDDADGFESSPQVDHSSHGNPAMEEAAESKIEEDAIELMERDQTIESVNHSIRSPHSRGRATPEDKRRFKGLLERLQDQLPIGDVKDSIAMFDPAVISFAAKNNSQRTPSKRGKQSRSDSGYTSPSSMPSTRAHSRMGGTNPSVTSRKIRDAIIDRQYAKYGSEDSGFGSPSKCSTLNPAAKEFSSTESNSGSPVKRAGVGRPPISSNHFVPPQQTQNKVDSFSSPNFGTALNHHHSVDVSCPIANINNAISRVTVDNPGIIPQRASGMLPQSDNSHGNLMQPPFDFGAAGVTPYAPQIGPVPGMPPFQGFDYPVLGSNPGIPAAAPFHSLGIPGPFHQQLPTFISCNNPTHQTLGAFNPQPPSVIAPLQMMPRSSFNAAPGPLIPPVGPVAPYLPKNVPKPKIPNTSGQQNWEYMHELRRMNEPGYAQKCKEKQKKRYLKQLDKVGLGGSRS